MLTTTTPRVVTSRAKVVLALIWKRYKFGERDVLKNIEGVKGFVRVPIHIRREWITCTAFVSSIGWFRISIKSSSALKLEAFEA